MHQNLTVTVTLNRYAVGAPTTMPSSELHGTIQNDEQDKDCKLMANDLGMFSSIAIFDFACQNDTSICASLKRRKTFPPALRSDKPVQYENMDLSLLQWGPRPLPVNRSHLWLTLGEKVGEGATGVIYRVHLRSPTTLDLPHQLCLKIAKPPFARFLAREGWFYEQLYGENLAGVTSPRCFGLYSIPRKTLNIASGRSTFEPWKNVDEPWRDQYFELDDDDETSSRYYHDDVNLDGRYESAWLDWEYDPKNRLILAMLLEEMGTVFDPFKETKDTMSDLRAIVEDLSLSGIQHQDLRFTNFMRPLRDVDGRYCSRHQCIHSWRVLDFERSVRWSKEEKDSTSGHPPCLRQLKIVDLDQPYFLGQL